MNEGLTLADFERGDLESLQQNAVREFINEEFKYGRTLVELYCFYGHLHCVRWLVENMGAAMGQGALFSVLDGKHNTECLEYVLSYGINLDMRDIEVARYLHRPSILKLLLAYGADPNLRLYGVPPLEYIFADTGPHHGLSTFCVQYLIDAGARLEDVNEKYQHAVESWMLVRQEQYKQRVRACLRAALAFYHVMRKHKCPKDLSLHVCKRWVLSTRKEGAWKEAAARSLFLQAPSSFWFGFIALIMFVTCLVCARL